MINAIHNQNSMVRMNKTELPYKVLQDNKRNLIEVMRSKYIESLPENISFKELLLRESCYVAGFTAGIDYLAQMLPGAPPSNEG